MVSALSYWLAAGSRLLEVSFTVFTVLVGMSFGLILLGGFLALVYSTRPHGACVTPMQAGLWVAPNAAVFSALIVLLPK